MLAIVLTLALYSALPAAAVLGYWFVAVRFGDTSDLDPDGLFMRWFRRRPSMAERVDLADSGQPIASSGPVSIQRPPGGPESPNLVQRLVVFVERDMEEGVGWHPPATGWIGPGT